MEARDETLHIALLGNIQLRVVEELMVKDKGSVM
jgi:hypothetical protein